MWRSRYVEQKNRAKKGGKTSKREGPFDEDPQPAEEEIVQRKKCDQGSSLEVYHINFMIFFRLI